MIRPYHPSDKPALLQLIKQNTPTYFAPKEQADFKTYLAENIEAYFVIEEHHHLLGCGGINYENQGKTGIISWDIVHPEFHQKGYGSRLLKHRIKLLKGNPAVTKVKVRTAQYTYKYYEKHGFTLVNISQDYWSKGYDLYDMEMPLM